MKTFVYVLKSKKDYYVYIGISKNPYKRLKEHNSGGSKYTKGHMPYGLVYQEMYSDRVSARFREKYLKSGEGRELLKSFI